MEFIILIYIEYKMTIFNSSHFLKYSTKHFMHIRIHMLNLK